MIRPAIEADIPRLAAIRNAVGENRLSDPGLVTPDDYRWFVAHGGIFVWQQAEIIAGFAAADRRNGSIWALFVDPLYERRGIGRALFERACLVLAEAGIQTMWLTTAPGTRAAHFYAAAGWRAAGLKDGQVRFECDRRPRSFP